MSKTILVNYASAADPALDAGLPHAEAVLFESATVGGIDQIISWDRRKLLSTPFYRDHRDILDRNRGAGCWLWKPYIILEALRFAGRDDTVVYWDAGQIKPNRFTRPIAPLVRWCRDHRGILPGVAIIPHGQWTKRDCFHLMGCDSEKYWSAMLIQTGFSLWSGAFAIELVSEWLHWCKDRRCLTDDANECGLENLPAFQEHRYDQSVLTNLCVKKGIPTPPAPSIPQGQWSRNINLWAELLEPRQLPPRSPALRATANDPLDRLVQAEWIWRTILAHEPQQPFAMHRLGLACLRTSRVPEGLDLLTRAAEALPQMSDVQHDLGSALENVGRSRQAMQYLSRAAALPTLKDASLLFVQLGNLSARLEDGVRAEVAYRQALIAKLDYAPAWLGLAELLLSQARHKEAIEALRRARLVRPDDAQLHSNLLRAMHSAPNCSQDEIDAEHRDWANQHGKPTLQVNQPYANDPSPRRRCRIGYMASDFDRRAIASFVEPLLTHHDRSAEGFEVFAYAASNQSRGIAQSLKTRVDVWRETNSDDETATRIRNDRIDILIDLTAHGPRTRLPVFSRRPAPLQVAWLGYPPARGLAAVDWRITDAWLDPTTAADSGERLLRLPRAFACYAAPDLPTNRIPSPGAATQMATFGYLGDPVDVTADMLHQWCRILRAVPHSRLLLRCDFDPPVLRDAADAQGVDHRRIETVRRFGSAAAYLEAFQWLDVALDTFPRNSHLSSCDALWMGVPLITLPGDRHESRMGASLLANLRLPELIAHTQDEYVTLAAGVARDRDRLAEFRRALPDQMRKSPLMDAVGFTRDMETLYRQIWEEWCASQKGASPIPAEALSL